MWNYIVTICKVKLNDFISSKAYPNGDKNGGYLPQTLKHRKGKFVNMLICNTNFNTRLTNSDIMATFYRSTSVYLPQFFAGNFPKTKYEFLRKNLKWCLVRSYSIGRS